MVMDTREVDLVSRYGGLGSLSHAASETVFGINHRGVGNALPNNTDNHGLTFFTRPRMNLSYDNLAMDRVLTPLLTADQYSYQRMVRVLLDPVGAYDRYQGSNGKTVQRLVTSPLVDDLSPFIPILSNTLLSLNGWPDPSVRFYDAKEGPQRETWSMIDDMPRNFGVTDLQATFANIAGDPITLLFNTWIRYAAWVYMGEMMPYPDAVMENEIDYQTRIYRLVLDPSRRYVQKIGSAVACFPYTSALGQAFDFSVDTPFVTTNAKQITIPFRSVGIEYQDPILIREFNDAVFMFNPKMAASQRNSHYRQLKPDELRMFNYKGYPYIHPRTLELQWFVPIEQYYKTVREMEIYSQTARQGATTP